MYLEIIKKTLVPRFKNISFWKSDEIVKSLIISFDSHCQIIANYILQNENKLDKLDIDFFIELHKIFYPIWYEIKALWNDWIQYIMKPWEFRKQIFYKHITNFSKVENIERDFFELINNFNSILYKNRKDIIKFYIDFLSVHPFWNSNGTIWALISDILCSKYWFKELNLLNIRFKDKNTLFKIIEIYETEKDLEKTLNVIDNFNKNN